MISLVKDGWLVADKPKDVSSAKALSKIRKLLKLSKAGHAGTLDPFATGILPIAFGNGTKTIQFLQNQEKTYLFNITWGVSTDTDDKEGKIIDQSSKIPSSMEIDIALKKFVGEIDQVPPKFSAIKINGKRAYELARMGDCPSLSARKVNISRFERVRENKEKNSDSFLAVCGKGTYIRSLARDLATHLGTFGYVSSLRRTAYGPFNEKMAISLDKITSLVHKTEYFEYIYPISIVLDDIPAVEINSGQADCIAHGRYVNVYDLSESSEKILLSKEQMVKVMYEDRVIALATIDQSKLRPFRVLKH